jgi:alkylhydroperoxidase family enzyme
MSARSAVALQQGVDEELLAEVDRYEDSDSDLAPAQKAALRLADAYLTAPAEMSDAAKQEVAANLTATQIVETVLKLMGFSNDKVMVALGLDFDEIKIFEM